MLSLSLSFSFPLNCMYLHVHFIVSSLYSIHVYVTHLYCEVLAGATDEGRIEDTHWSLVWLISKGERGREGGRVGEREGDRMMETDSLAYN